MAPHHRLISPNKRDDSDAGTSAAANVATAFVTETTYASLTGSEALQYFTASSSTSCEGCTQATESSSDTSVPSYLTQGAGFSSLLSMLTASQSIGNHSLTSSSSSTSVLTNTTTTTTSTSVSVTTTDTTTLTQVLPQIIPVTVFEPSSNRTLTVDEYFSNSKLYSISLQSATEALQSERSAYQSCRSSISAEATRASQFYSTKMAYTQSFYVTDKSTTFSTGVPTTVTTYFPTGSPSPTTFSHPDVLTTDLADFRALHGAYLPDALLASSKGGLSKGQIAGIAVGSVVGFVIALLLAFWALFLRRRSRSRSSSTDEKAAEAGYGTFDVKRAHNYVPVASTSSHASASSSDLEQSDGSINFSSDRAKNGSPFTPNPPPPRKALVIPVRTNSSTQHSMNVLYEDKEAEKGSGNSTRSNSLSYSDDAIGGRPARYASISSKLRLFHKKAANKIVPVAPQPRKNAASASTKAPMVVDTLSSVTLAGGRIRSVKPNQRTHHHRKSVRGGMIMHSSSSSQDHSGNSSHSSSTSSDLDFLDDSLDDFEDTDEVDTDDNYSGRSGHNHRGSNGSNSSSSKNLL